MEAEYTAANETVMLRNFLTDLEVVASLQSAIKLYCNYSGAVANSKESRATSLISTSSKKHLI